MWNFSNLRPSPEGLRKITHTGRILVPGIFSLLSSDIRIMKQITLLLLMISSFAVQAQFEEEYEALRRSQYTPAFIFADRVNLRADASLNSAIVATVQEATPVGYVQRTNVVDTVGDKAAAWIKIWYNEQFCYVWEPLLTLYAQRSYDDTDVMFLFGPSAEQESTRVKVFRASEKTQDFEFVGLKWYNGIERLRIGRNRGVDLVEEFLYVHYAGHSCGAINGDVMFAWDGVNLRPFFTEWYMGDAGFYEGTRIILPGDPAGEKGIIHVYEEAVEYEYDEEEDDYTQDTDLDEQIHTKYLWDGFQLVEMVN